MIDEAAIFDSDIFDPDIFDCDTATVHKDYKPVFMDTRMRAYMSLNSVSYAELSMDSSRRSFMM